MAAHFAEKFAWKLWFARLFERVHPFLHQRGLQLREQSHYSLFIPKTHYFTAESTTRPVFCLSEPYFLAIGSFRKSGTGWTQGLTSLYSISRTCSKGWWTNFLPWPAFLHQHIAVGTQGKTSASCSSVYSALILLEIGRPQFSERPSLDPQEHILGPSSFESRPLHLMLFQVAIFRRTWYPRAWTILQK
jgi:hypothetical protein